MIKHLALEGLKVAKNEVHWKIHPKNEALLKTTQYFEDLWQNVVWLLQLMVTLVLVPMKAPRHIKVKKP